MSFKSSLLCIVMLCFSLSTARAEPIVSGSSGVNGKSINYRFVGEKSATASSSFTDEAAEISGRSYEWHLDISSSFQHLADNSRRPDDSYVRASHH